MADRITRLHLDVDESFLIADSAKRVEKLQSLGLEIIHELFPVFSWIERRRSIEAANLVRARIDIVLTAAVKAAATGGPKPSIGRTVTQAMGSLSAGVKQAAEVLVASRIVAAYLVDWANDIEAEDRQREASNADLFRGQNRDSVNDDSDYDATGATRQGDCGALIPRWDASTRTVYLGDVKVVSYSRRAPAQFAILEAFQAANWSRTVSAPRQTHSLKDAVDALNIKLATTRLRIHRHDNDTRIEWTLSPV
jgi:hypothetical protein